MTTTCEWCSSRSIAAEAISSSRKSGYSAVLAPPTAPHDQRARATEQGDQASYPRRDAFPQRIVSAPTGQRRAGRDQRRMGNRTRLPHFGQRLARHDGITEEMLLHSGDQAAASCVRDQAILLRESLIHHGSKGVRRHRLHSASTLYVQELQRMSSLGPPWRRFMTNWKCDSLPSNSQPIGLLAGHPLQVHISLSFLACFVHRAMHSSSVFTFLFTLEADEYTRLSPQAIGSSPNGSP